MRVSRLLTSRRLFVLLASVIVLIVIVGLTLNSQAGNAGWAQSVVMDTENTVGGWLYQPVSQLTSFLQGVHNLQEMYVQNSRLKTEMQNYAALEIQLKDAQAQDARLSQMLGFKQGAGRKFHLLPARVVGRSPTAWTSEITIDVGTADGASVNMPVVAADGSLVGRIESSAAYSSKVILVTDTQVGDGVSARVQVDASNQPFGIVVGSTSVSGDLEMQFLSPLAQVKPGDTVVTSGLSTLFPAGIAIGTIVSMQTGLQGLTQSALIAPSANLDYLQDLFVIQTASTTGSRR